jgi:hypothetical protein
LGEAFEVGPGLGRHEFSSVEVEAAVLPGVEHLHAFGGQELFLDEKKVNG